MKIGKWKWLATLLATACCAVCFGFGVALGLPAADGITAQAASTTYTVTSFGATSASSTTAVYAYALTGDTPGVSSWAHAFTFEEGTGKGFLYNGEKLTSYEVKQPGTDFYIVPTGKTAVAGDTLVLDGTFSNADADVAFNFENCGLRYNGSTWETYYDLGSMVLHGNSKKGGAAGSNNAVLYLAREDGEALPVQSWTYTFAYESGTGFKVNGEQKTPAKIQSTDGGLYFSFDAVDTNDVITIGGTFYCESQNVVYDIDESSFVWNGGNWVVYDASAEYNTYNVGKVAIASGSATAVYFNKASGEAFEATDSSEEWVEVLTYLGYGADYTGVGITLNGEPIVMNDIKIPSNIYVGLGATAAENDELVISGTFYNETLKVKYVIEESKFTWNGSAWEAIYTEYTTDSIEATSGNGGTDLYILPTSGSFGLNADDWNNVYTFESDSGEGMYLNDTKLTTTDIKQPYAFFIRMETAAVAGDIFSIDGTFYNATTAKKITFNDCQMQFDGTTWNTYEPVVYTPYELGVMTVGSDSRNSNASASALYLTDKDGNDLPGTNGSWDTKFTFSSGGVKLDGVDITNSLGNIQNPGQLYIGLNTTVSAGQVVTVSGTIYNEDAAIKYVIDESKFTWNGTIWEAYVEYTTYDLGEGTLDSLSATAGSDAVNSWIYLDWTAETFPDNWSTWDNLLDYSGVTFKVGDTTSSLSKAVASNEWLFIEFAAVEENTTVTVSGEFVYASAGVKITLEESKFTWNGSAWEAYVEYTTHNIGALELHSHSTNGTNSTASNILYLQRADGEALPFNGWANPFVATSGGLTVNGETVAITEMQSADGTVYLVFDAVETGDTVAIAGTFFCEKQSMYYVITESKFVWNGTIWEKYIEYTPYELGVMSLATPSKTTGAASSQLYLLQESLAALPVEDWNSANSMFSYVSGSFKVNGVSTTLSEVKSTPEGLFLAFAAVNVGDVVTLSGTVYSQYYAVKYTIEESIFEYNGSIWVISVSEDSFEQYDVVSLTDLGYGLSQTVDATGGAVDKTGSAYALSEGNTTGSVKFRFGYNSNSTSGALEIRLRGSNWLGIRFILNSTSLQSFYNSNITTVTLEEDDVIELGAIDLTDGERIFIYARVNDALVITDLVNKTDVNTKEGDDDNDRPLFSTFTTGSVSLYFGGGSNYTLTDPDHVQVTYVTENGSFTDYAEKDGSYKLISGRSYKTFVAWENNGTLYFAGDEVEFSENTTYTALEVDFFMTEGAAIRIASSADESGIRFISNLNMEDYTKLVSTYGLGLAYGTLIMPYDYLTEGQSPNLEDFEAGNTVLKISGSIEKVDNDGTNYIYYGAMKNLKEGNYDRAFAGRGYLTLTYGERTINVYTPFNVEDNVRSIRYVAQAIKADSESGYNNGDYSDTKKGIIDAYAASDSITLMPYTAYKANKLDRIAWYHPELESSNAYNNDTNIAIAEKMKNAGITGVYLDGMYHISLDTQERIDKTMQMIEFFWSQGLQTIAYAGEVDYATQAYPDFSSCEGFIGFLVKDEPASSAVDDNLAALAEKFNTLYAGTDVTFMINLLPSYAAEFNGTTNWWQSSFEGLEKDEYKAYLQDYCDTVLSKIDGEKWLSLDSYPVNADYSLTQNFLFDLAMLKYYAEYSGATSHIVLQSSGWQDVDESTGETYDGKCRMPTEAELRMQAYAAMAFGIDSISWWSYSDKRLDNQYNPTDSGEYYTAFATVNNELAAISSVYSAFDWKGVILGKGDQDKNAWGFSITDEDYDAYAAVEGQIGDYELSVENTKHLSAIETNQSYYNYLMGVMEDMNGNEGYVLCNYNELGSASGDKTQTITLTFDTGVTQVVIYSGGVATTVDVTDGKLAVELATGEGVIILPCSLG